MQCYYQTPDLGGISRISPQRTLCIDLETTGLSAKTDEILEMGFVDGAGRTVLWTLVRPLARHEWPHAQRVNGISPSDVAAAPTIVDLLRDVRRIVEGADMIVGFNTSFDLGFLAAVGVSPARVPVVDVMRELAPVCGVWDVERRSYRLPKLSACAERYGVRLKPHGALEDARATADVFQRMIADAEPDGYLALAARHGVFLA